MKKQKIRDNLIASLKLSGFKNYFINSYWYELKIPNSNVIVSICLQNTDIHKKYYIQITEKINLKLIYIYTGTINKNSFNKIINFINLTN